MAANDKILWNHTVGDTPVKVSDPEHRSDEALLTAVRTFCEDQCHVGNSSTYHHQLAEDLSVARELAFHMKGFTSHLQRISAPESFHKVHLRLKMLKLLI